MLADTTALKPWLGRLEEFGLVGNAGRTNAKRYFVIPDVARDSNVVPPTTLGRIQPHRLRELIVQDLTRYPRSRSRDIRKRIGEEIAAHTLRRALEAMKADGLLNHDGAATTARVYWLTSSQL